jgi:hypothetical protein
MVIANVIHRVLENKQSLLELHSADGASFYLPIYIMYLKQYNYRIYQTCKNLNKIGEKYFVYYISTIKIGILYFKIGRSFPFRYRALFPLHWR